jgi:hypothetical protein
MLAIYLLTILLSMSLFLNHGYKLVLFYQWLYRKLYKPKFSIGEFVMINDIEYEIMLITQSYRPYTYYCLPKYIKNVSLLRETYFHESKIKKKTGILKELE